MIVHMLVAALASAFFLALIEQVFEMKLLKAPIALVLSGLGCLQWFALKELFVVIPAVAFLSLLIMQGADKLTSYKQAVVRSIRQEL